MNWGDHHPNYPDDGHAVEANVLGLVLPCWSPLPEGARFCVARAKCCGQIFYATGLNKWEADWTLQAKLRDHIGLDFARGGRFFS